MQLDLSDRVAEWTVRLSDGVHLIRFDHGTTSGKRVIYVDEKEVMRREWMFKLVGAEHFSIGRAECCIHIQAMNSFAYEYSMEVNGKSLKKFTENQSKILRSWIAEFTDSGCETHFAVDPQHHAYISAESSGKRKRGILHKLYLNETLVPETIE